VLLFLTPSLSFRRSIKETRTLIRRPYFFERGRSMAFERVFQAYGTLISTQHVTPKLINRGIKEEYVLNKAMIQWSGPAIGANTSTEARTTDVFRLVTQPIACSPKRSCFFPQWYGMYKHGGGSNWGFQYLYLIIALRFIGRSDETVRFQCGGGLNLWKDTDGVWEEYVGWFPFCVFVRHVRGLENASGRSGTLL
jgi:hypothetical protein